MPGLYKMNSAGLQFLRETFKKDTSIPFTQLLVRYNDEAKVRGWMCLRSPYTISYHLNAMGLYQNNTRIVANKDFGHKLIKASIMVKKELAIRFGVSYETVCNALNFQTQTKLANDIRVSALNNGGKLFEESENPYKQVVTL